MLTTQVEGHIIDTSMLFQERGISIKRGIDVSKKTVRELRNEALLTAFDLAAKSEVSLSTISRIEKGSVPVTRRVAVKVITALSKSLKRPIGIEDVENLKVK
jgi:DNA-binding XRE family transcriptional regulator